jgi:uncharacterized protein (TIGR01777 family)
MQPSLSLLLESKLFPIGCNFTASELHLNPKLRTNRMTMDAPISEKVTLSGASGMLGSAIGKALTARRATVLRLVRRDAKAPGELRWNPAVGEIPAEELEGISAAVHLSGANVASRRWTAKYKREMKESRVGSTRLLAEALATLKNKPGVLITASAVGFYGNRGDEILDEDSMAGKGYFPELCAAWEAATRPAEEAGIRVVHLRFGVVLGRDGGILARLTPLFKLGLGGRLGNGRQWSSWISEADAVAAALFALENANVSGAIHVVSPNPVTNAEFTRELGRAVHRPTPFPAPAFALRLAFGEMADEALLASTRAVPKRLVQAGFTFAHPTLADAIAAALAK